MAVQPRPTASVNETIRDRFIAHAIFLERLKSGEAAKIVANLRDDVVPSLLSDLEARMVKIEVRGFDIGPAETRRLRDMIEAMNGLVVGWASGVSTELGAALVEIAAQEAAWTAGAVNQAIPPAASILVEMVVPATQLLRAALVKNPIDGVLLEDTVRAMGRRTSDAVSAEIRRGIVTGATTSQIIAKVRRIGDTTETTARAVVRTAVAHASSTARSETYGANTDILKGIGWVSTLDTRTCAVCGNLDGQVFPVASGPRPPRHILCRCSTIPILKSWAELGINAKELSPGTRASLDGQVPEKVTYADWIKRQSPEMQNDALGPERGKLLRAGKFAVGDFVDRQGEQYTLRELKARDPAAFARTGIRLGASERLSVASITASRRFESVIDLSDDGDDVLDRLGFSPTRFADRMEAVMPQDLRKGRWGLKLTDEEEVTFSYVKPGGGGPALQMQRTFRLGGNNIEVHHDYLRVAEDLQGTGVAKALLAEMFDLYREIGVSMVDVYANIDVGGYAWAKYGFKPVQSAWDSMRRSFLRRVDELVPDYDGRAADLAYLRGILETDEPDAIWDLVDLPPFADDKISIGKKLLLGQNWDGEIELDDEAAMDRLNAYLRTRK